MKDTAAASRYARAFIDAFCKDTKTLDDVSSEINQLAEIYSESRELRNVAQNPVVSSELKKKIIGDIMSKSGFCTETEKAVNIILENGRMALLGTVAEQFESLVFDKLGKVRVEVTSATKLTAEDETALTQKLKEVTGKDAVINKKVNPDLIGGIITKVGSYVSDGSVSSQLKALRVEVN